MGQSFQIRNPHAVAACGCGTSFSIYESRHSPSSRLAIHLSPLVLSHALAISIDHVRDCMSPVWLGSVHDLASVRGDVSALFLERLPRAPHGAKSSPGTSTASRHALNRPSPTSSRRRSGRRLPAGNQKPHRGLPGSAFEDLGYHCAVHGQKGFNGVAILSKLRFDEVSRGLPGADTDEQARVIEGVFSTPSGALRVASLYLPNGNPIGTDKFVYKLAWMERLERWAAESRLALEEPLVLAGDYNVIPEPIDVPESRGLGTRCAVPARDTAGIPPAGNLGFTEALRACNDGADIYTFWDYQAGAWQKNNGIRIDHLMLSPEPPTGWNRSRRQPRAGLGKTVGSRPGHRRLAFSGRLIFQSLQIKILHQSVIGLILNE